MYNWKFSSFKFGKSKDDKSLDQQQHQPTKKTSGFFNFTDHSSSSIERKSVDTAVSSKGRNSERQNTITESISSYAPVRHSNDISTHSDESSVNKTWSSEDVERPTEPVENVDNLLSPSTLTIKVYSGEGFALPFPITSNKMILSRLVTSGVTSGSSNSNGNSRDFLANQLNNLVSQISNLQLEDNFGSDEVVLSGESYSKYIPSIIKLPSSERLSPLLYFTIEFDNTVATIEPESGMFSNPTFNKISIFDVTRKLPNLKIDVFVRIPSIMLPSSNWQHTYGSQDEKVQEFYNKINSNQDVLIGSHILPLDLKIDSAANIRLYSHHWIALDNVPGKINITVDYKPSKNKPISIDDFNLLKVIGKGSFGKVMQVRKKDTQKIYALKAIKKAYIVSKSEVTHTLAERTVLSKVDCPFVVPLKFTFQSPEKLYIVLAFINGGELFYHLQKEGRFSLSRARFYTAELLCALEALHKMNVIYRDLKPENILLDYKGHIALCDFGLSKIDMKDKDKTDTFCGTPEYLAPELLLGQGYSKVVDWWTLGVLLYEMLTGLPPYYDEDVPKMYKKILQEPLKFPDGFDKEAKDLLIGLLSRDPKRRLGYNGAAEIKNHPFFSQLSWSRLWAKGYIPPFKPLVSSSIDTSNFDQEFTKENPVDSVVDEFLSESVQQQFGGWTYVGNEQLGSSLNNEKTIG